MGLFRKHKPDPSLEGAKAKRQAEHDLAVHKTQHEEISEIAEQIRRVRERNHFAENIEAIWGEARR